MELGKKIGIRFKDLGFRREKRVGKSRCLGFSRERERERKGLREGIKKPGENERENHFAPGR